MALTFTTTDQAGTLNGVKCLTYGPAGAGKTVLCATAPAPLIISCESGLLSLRKVRVPAIIIKDINELGEAYRWVTTSNEARQFQTICLDSLTEIAEVLLAHLMKTVGSKDPRKAYGELVPQMSTVVRMFRDLPGKNVYMSAKMEQMKDEGTGIILWTPSCPGNKLGPQLPYFFDEVFYLGVGQDQNKQTFRYLQTQPDLQHVAKDRSGSLAPMEPPDLTKLFTKIVS